MTRMAAFRNLRAGGSLLSPMLYSRECSVQRRTLCLSLIRYGESGSKQTKMPKVHQAQSSNFDSENHYHDIANETLEGLYNYLDEEVASILLPTLPSYDVSLSQGILTIELPGKGVYVINKQPPNQEIWASSPVSGPARFAFDKKRSLWIYPRNKLNLHDMLTAELNNLFSSIDASFDFSTLPYGPKSQQK